jgi:hypothetical protein
MALQLLYSWHGQRHTWVMLSAAVRLARGFILLVARGTGLSAYGVLRQGCGQLHEACVCLMLQHGRVISQLLLQQAQVLPLGSSGANSACGADTTSTGCSSITCTTTRA